MTAIPQLLEMPGMVSNNYFYRKKSNPEQFSITPKFYQFLNTDDK